jgi:hypothetical protein
MNRFGWVTGEVVEAELISSLHLVLKRDVAMNIKVCMYPKCEPSDDLKVLHLARFLYGLSGST